MGEQVEKDVQERGSRRQAQEEKSGRSVVNAVYHHEVEAEAEVDEEEGNRR